MRKFLLPILGLALLLCWPFIAEKIGAPAMITLFTRMMILGLAASALNIALGFGGLVSLGHAAFYGIGAYAIGISTTHAISGEPFLGLVAGSNLLIVNVLVAVVVSGVAAAIIGALALRTSGI